jgi:hypothetical protein
MKWVIGTLKSKTMHFFAWAGAIVPVLAAWLPEIQASIPQIRGYVPENLYKHAFVAVVVGGIALRLITTKPITGKS